MAYLINPFLVFICLKYTHVQDLDSDKIVRKSLFWFTIISDKPAFVDWANILKCRYKFFEVEV